MKQGCSVTVSVRNSSGAWEVIDREPAHGGIDVGEVEVSAHDIGSPVGQDLLIELRDHDDEVIESTETRSL